MQSLSDKVLALLSVYGLNVLAAIAIFVFGLWFAKIMRRVIGKVMERGNVDATLTRFVGNLSYIALLVFVVLAAVSKLGIQTTSFIAVLGAAGLAIGLALQGSLSNFAAGFLMIIFRPFKVGDYIEAGGTAGTVEEIQIFTTQLKTPDNKTVIIPNSGITAGNIVNYSTKGTRRVDMVFGIGYDDDIDKAKAVLQQIIDADARVLKDPAVTIGLSELADSSVNFVVRPWVKSEDYWSFLFDTTEKVKKRFDAEGIGIPYPQQDVHLYQHTT